MTALRELRGHTGTTASSAGNGSTVLHTRRHTSSVPAQRNNGQPAAQHAVTHPTAENPGAVSGRGCARGTGRRPAHLTPVPAQAAPAKAATAPPAPVSARSEAEFTEYVRQRRASLYATAFHLTGDRFEAEDLLQSALFSTYRAWDRISDKAAVGGYLRRTMTNLHISAWRRRKLNEYPTEELPETPSTGDVDAMRGTELRAVLWQALARLPEPQRTMLVLRYYEGRTDPEIADILGISVGTVKSSIWRSLRRLRDDEVLARGRDEQECFGELVA
ncbi:SigE family RNA polymerase sigma factor [Streptomyces chumphonensis]|uniref:SigE family RNA polymerase sigma factor n=1 Tax=Streptomyces chumphonensis TaxID=1214925 RepID=UPI003D7305CD